MSSRRNILSNRRTSPRLSGSRQNRIGSRLSREHGHGFSGRKMSSSKRAAEGEGSRPSSRRPSIVPQSPAPELFGTSSRYREQQQRQAAPFLVRLRLREEQCLLLRAPTMVNLSLTESEDPQIVDAAEPVSGRQSHGEADGVTPAGFFSLVDFLLTRFLHANRHPPTDQVRGHASLEKRSATSHPSCRRPSILPPSPAAPTAANISPMPSRRASCRP